MAHFAQLDDNNQVTQVIVIANKDTADENGIEKEEIGIAFCKSLFGENTKWVQTSFNGNIRNKFAGIGDYYDEENNEFYVDPELAKYAISIVGNIIDVEVVEPTPAIEQ